MRDRMATGPFWGAAGGAATVSGEAGPAAFEHSPPERHYERSARLAGLKAEHERQGGFRPGRSRGAKPRSAGSA